MNLSEEKIVTADDAQVIKLSEEIIAENAQAYEELAK